MRESQGVRDEPVFNQTLFPVNFGIITEMTLLATNCYAGILYGVHICT